MPTARAGQLNLRGLVNPGAYVINNLPTPNAPAIPTNIEGLVGVASWGPVDSVMTGSVNNFTSIIGTPMLRNADIANHVSAASQMGANTDFRFVRVTDGTDTAAQATIQSTCGQATARYTGVLGNNITIVFQTTGAVGAFAAIVSGTTGTPERFDNIFNALQSVTVTPGTGYTSVPVAQVTAPQIAGGKAATVQPTLVSLAPTLGVGGTGHVVDDVVTFGAGLSIKVLTVASGVIETFSVVTPGLITSGGVPATVGNQTSSTGAGTGATLTMAWGLGTPTFTNGSGYYTATGTPLAITLVGGGATTPGTYTPVLSFWAALASAINGGTVQRGRSNFIVYTPGTGTAPPITNVVNTLSGGTDGASGVGSIQLLGVDGSQAQRTGAYVLRGSGMDCFELCDSTDDTLWGALTSLAIQESALAVGVTAESDTIEDCVSTRQSVGQDDPNFWLICGDFPTFTDGYFGARTVSPAAIALGLAGNLSPEQSPINKPLVAVIGTQTSQMGVVVSDADETVANTGGIDIIGQSVDLGEDYFSFLTGLNTSSNNEAQGVEYTRLTNYLIKVLQATGKAFVGKLQSQELNDPTRTSALQTFDSLGQSLASPSAGSGGYGLIDNFLMICALGDGNNTPQTIQAGQLYLTANIEYLNVVRIFVINLFGGGNVSVTLQAPSTATSPLVVSA